MKLEPVTKIHKRNKTTSKKIDDDIILKNCDVILIFLIYGLFGVMRKLMFSLTVTFHLTTTENRTKDFLTLLSHYCFE